MIRALAASMVVHVALVLAAVAARPHQEPSRRGGEPAVSNAVVEVTLVDAPSRVAEPLPPVPARSLAPTAPTTVRAMPRALAARVSAPAHAAAPASAAEGSGVAPPDPRGDVTIGTGSSSDVGSGNGDGSGLRTGGHGSRPVPLGPHQALLPYTHAALDAHVEGNVLVELRVDIDGTAHDARVVAGLGYGLDAIALQLAAQLRFLPARDAADRAVAVQITWRFHFAPPRS